MARLPGRARPDLSVEEQAPLKEYAVRPRYPGWREVPLCEACAAIALARRANLPVVRLDKLRAP